MDNDWKSLRDTVSLTFDFIWEALTISNGMTYSRCDNEDLLYVWSPKLCEVILTCDFCSISKALGGLEIEVDHIEPATTLQLVSAGVLKEKK